MQNPYHTAKSITKTTNLTEDDLFDNLLNDEKANFEMDEELFELRQRYMEMKKDRQKAEKDSGLLENKLKLLQNEEQKVIIGN